MVGLGVGLMAMLAYAVSARLWRGDLGVPFTYTNDAEAMMMIAKGIIDHGWIQSNPSLGAPNGQVWFDYPLGGDNLNFALMKAVSLFTSSPASS